MITNFRQYDQLLDHQELLAVPPFGHRCWKDFFFQNDESQGKQMNACHLNRVPFLRSRTIVSPLGVDGSAGSYKVNGIGFDFCVQL